MSTAFALTLAYLGEHTSAADTASAFAAYITGNVASNLFGRLLAAGMVDHLGLAANFYVFAGLNFSGAVLVWFSVERTPRMREVDMRHAPPLSSWLAHLANPALRAAFAIGFLHPVRLHRHLHLRELRAGASRPSRLGMMMLGAVYFVFLPSIVTTPLAGRIVARLRHAADALGHPSPSPAPACRCCSAGSLAALLAGLALVAVGTFFAQATATGFVGRAATADRGSASGLYLASYFLGGLVGSAVLGQVFDRLGWTACVIGIGVALMRGFLLSNRLRPAA